eukprot:g14599.t1
MAAFTGNPAVTTLLVNADSDLDAIVSAVVQAAHQARTGILSNAAGRAFFDGTPLDYANFIIREENGEGKDTAESQLRSVEAVQRLLPMRMEAVRAVSWLWPSDAPSVNHAAAEEASRNATTSTPLTSLLPILRRRTRSPRILLAAMFRNPAER